MLVDGFVKRSAGKVLARLYAGFPVIGITGPRQAGKTTLARQTFPDKVYVTLEDPDQLLPVEIKSGQTLVAYFFKGLKRWRTLAGDAAGEPALIYGGDENQQRSGMRVYGWQSVEGLKAITE